MNKCLVKACNNISFSLVDGENRILTEKGYCLAHSSNPTKVQLDILDFIMKNDEIVGLDVQGMKFYDIDIEGKSFFGCNLIHSNFSNLHAKKCRFLMCVSDFSVYTNCSFLQCNFQFSSFAGGKFSHCIFSDGEIIQNNFNGIKSFQSSFDNSDLYNSRFINSRLADTSFRNCNLKKTNFLSMVQSNVSFKISNTREAIFDNEEVKKQVELNNK